MHNEPKIAWRQLWAPTLTAAALLSASRAAISLQASGVLKQQDWSVLWMDAAGAFSASLTLALLLALVAAYLSSRCAGRAKLGLVCSLLSLLAFSLFIGSLWPLNSSSFIEAARLGDTQAGLTIFFGAFVSTIALLPAISRRVGRISAFAAGALMLACLTQHASPSGGTWPSRPNIILVSIDTLRPDHLSCYGYELNTSPNIDRFAEKAVRFNQVFTPYPWTLVSHMSLFTSLNPTAHGVDQKRALAPGIPTLATHLQANGYRTVAILDSVKWLSPGYQFNRGFDTYLQVKGSAENKRKIIDPFLDDLGARPFFLFLHFFDVHSDGKQLPYESSPEDYEQFAGDYQGDFTGCVDGMGCASKLLLALNQKNKKLNGDELDYLIGLYDAGIRTFDREFGLLLQNLEERDLYENSVIALTADHGEAFFEHGFALHGSVFDEVVRIPLLIKTPSVTGDRVENQLLSIIDIAPTLLEHCGITVDGMRGTSFYQLIEEPGAASRERPDWVLLEDGRGRWQGIRTERWKALRMENQKWAFFDLKADPNEKKNLLKNGATPPPEFAPLLEQYEAERAKMLSLRSGRSGGAKLSATEEERAELEGLGYLGEFDE